MNGRNTGVIASLVPRLQSSSKLKAQILPLGAELEDGSWQKECFLS